MKWIVVVAITLLVWSLIVLGTQERGPKPMTEAELMTLVGRMQVQLIQQARYIQELEKQIDDKDAEIAKLKEKPQP